MKLDFTIINKIDGMSIYANKILENIYSSFKNDLFLFHYSYKKKILKEVNYKKISNTILHRLNLGLFDKEFYYSPTHHAPIFNKNKILTVHDITPLILKDKSFKQYIYYKYFLRTSIKYTRKIITVSEYTKKRLIENYSLLGRENDIIVIHNATDIDEINEIEVKNLPEKYLFFPGVHSEYKNYKRVIKALDNLNIKDLNLIITTNSDEVKEYCDNYSFVQILSGLEYGQIKYLYLNSIGLIYPSLIEGFGFPALEAARLKIPIITTKDSSMEEFLKENAAIYVDPYSVKDISLAIQHLLNNDLNDMINIAYKNTKELTWEENSKKVVKIIKENCE
jgi:hypothetical protein